MKNLILTTHAKHPEWTFTEIATHVGCAFNTVKFHLDPECRKYFAIRRAKNQKKSVQRIKLLFGGKCDKCGYNKCLEALCFHHLDPTTKEGNVIRTLKSVSWKKGLEEAQKCRLLCSNCHIEIHKDILEASRSINGTS